MARLNVNWRSLDQVAPQALVTGKALTEEEAAANRVIAEKPMMILVTPADPTDSTMAKLEGVYFANEQVAVGTKFFDCIRVSDADAGRDRILAEAGKDAPRIVFLNRDYSVAEIMEANRISAGRLKKAMANVVKDTYENNFDRMLRGYVKLLNELDQLEGVRARLEDYKARLADKPDPRKERKLQRDQEEYEKDVEKWQQEENELLAFKVRDGTKV